MTSPLMSITSRIYEVKQNLDTGFHNPKVGSSILPPATIFNAAGSFGLPIFFGHLRYRRNELFVINS